MTDLNTHILPHMDGNNLDVKTSAELLRQEYTTGTYRIALTPCFDCRKETADAFLRRRSDSIGALMQYADTSRSKLHLKLGAEVCYSPELMRTDLRPLCLEGTDVLLLRLPEQTPEFLPEALTQMQRDGLIPLIANANRLSYVRNHPGMLADWIELGALIQVDANALLRNDSEQKLVLNLLRWRLAQIVSSGASHPEKQPVRLSKAMRILIRHVNPETAIYVQETARTLFDGQEPEYPEFHRPKYVLGRWI